MRAVTWTIRLILFIVLLAFAAKNTDPVALRFYFDMAWEVPLVLLLFGFFAAGIAIGVIAVLGTLLRQRREILRLRRESRQRESAPRADVEPGPGAPPITGF
jgi:uncharacterized integral membrane protein